MRFAVLARVVMAAACVTLVAAATLERREPQLRNSKLVDTLVARADTVFDDLSSNKAGVSTRAVVAPVP